MLRHVLALLFKFAGHHGNQVRRNRLRLAPAPGLHSLRGIGDADQFAVGYRLPVRRNGQDHVEAGAVVRIVVDGNVVARVFGFALRPDLLRLIRAALVRQDEKQALLRLAVVANQDFVFLAGLARRGQVDVELLGVGGKMRVLAVHLHGGNVQVHGIKIQLRDAVAQRGKRMGHLAHHLALLHVEAQLDARVRQVVVAAGSVGLVRKRCRNENCQQREQQRGPPEAPPSAIRELGRSMTAGAAAKCRARIAHRVVSRQRDVQRRRLALPLPQVGIFLANPIFTPGREKV